MDRMASLTAFARVVESGGFTAAARRLNMSTTAVSNHVQALEEGLGVRLLNRTTRRVSLTEVGREYYDRCSQILAELDEADRIAGALQLTPRGHLRVHCHSSIVRFVAPIAAAYLQDNPEVSLDLRMGEQMIDLLEEGFDLAIRTYMPPDSSLTVRRLAGWRHVLCCAPSYLEHHSAPRTPADLADHNCLRYAFYSYGDDWHFVDPSGKPVVVRVAGSLVTSSAHLLRAAALSGGGVLLAAPFIMQEELAAGSLVRLLPEYQTVEFAIAAVYPHRRYLAAKVRRFLDALVARFTEQPWLDIAALGPREP
ncbi:MAG TPA: LysR family transcriptional regulator [Stellaceae bacterium]|nr:LysR family transcriptional regulator [Stellaceae bacterium]